MKGFWHSWSKNGAGLDRDAPENSLFSEGFWSHPSGLNRRPADYETENPPLSPFVLVVNRAVLPLLAVQSGGFWMGNWMGKLYFRPYSTERGGRGLVARATALRPRRTRRKRARSKRPRPAHSNPHCASAVPSERALSWWTDAATRCGRPARVPCRSRAIDI